jgi:GNAT superfamily N-acetyltransferase
MSDFKIRQYEPSDLEQCRSLWEELTQHHRDIYEDPFIGGETPGLYFDEHLARVGPEYIWVAEHEATIVGFTGLIMEDKEAEVEPLVVRGEYRNQGIGRALLDHVIKEAQSRGIRYLNVRPVARNLSALSFFYEQGFQTLGHIQLFMDFEDSKTWKSGITLFGYSFKY